MPDATRPTPDEIEQMLEDKHDSGFTSSPSISEFVNELYEHGYRIVHPDDVPERREVSFTKGIDYAFGWNDCRASIFGDA